MLSRFLSSLVATLIVTLLAPSVAAADGPDEPVLTFEGGGWGHGVGMSQYGALGRALAGQTYDEILAFYYDGANLVPTSSLALPANPADVDVLVAVRPSVALSPPNDQPGWAADLTIDGRLVATVDRTVTATFDGAAWHAAIVDGSGQPVDLCGTGCVGGRLALELGDGDRVVVESHADGPNIGEYAHGRIELVPNGVTTAEGPITRCGNTANRDFCVVNAAMTLDEYLRGIAEVPTNWPTAALQAQVVAARTYAVHRMSVRAAWPEFDLYSSTSDQVFVGWGKERHCGTAGDWCGAVAATSGQVLVHGGRLIEAVYSSSNGGHTASNSDVWGSSPRPYLRARPDPFDTNSANPNASWQRTYTVADISRWLSAYPGADLDVGDVVLVRLTNVPTSGFVDRATVVVEGTDRTVTTSGYHFWRALTAGCGAQAGCAPLKGRNFDIRAFLDVPANAFYAVPVAWMTANEITKGLDANTFGPGNPNTRGGLVTFLHRFADLPAAELPTEFVDVEPNAFYELAVAWAADVGVTSGVTDETFLPYGIVTRDQAAAMLHRFAGEPRPTVAIPFDDVPDTAYYADAVRWMVEWGITTGTTDTTFSPGEILTRGQIATFLWRLAGTPDAFADGAALPSSMRVS